MTRRFRRVVAFAFWLLWLLLCTKHEVSSLLYVVNLGRRGPSNRHVHWRSVQLSGSFRMPSARQHQTSQHLGLLRQLVVLPELLHHLLQLSSLFVVLLPVLIDPCFQFLPLFAEFLLQSFALTLLLFTHLLHVRLP